jgi:glycosyltransferase involved in cell wall biosynthesis
MFFPRGGSAQVARYVARALPDAGWDVTLVAGSLGREDEASHAPTFFEGVEDVRVVDYTEARDAPDPLAADPPFQPSFEDRAGAPDRVFASVDDHDYERLVATWQGVLADAGAADADLLHLHHLTPMNEAAARSFPDVPVIGHLHGTEVLMLNAIDEGPPPGWEHAEKWAERMRGWAQRCERLLVLSPDAIERVPDLLGVEPGRVVWAPNGFEPESFDRRPLVGEERRALWRRWLVEEPLGWDESGEPGSVRYSEEDLEAFDGPVLLYVGRFTEVKRIPLLIRAFARARERFGRRAALVLLGGYPGEWEGEHPLEVVRETGVEDVFLAGWRGHDDLPDGLNASDAVVLPSVHEQFGQVLVEGMACGLPCVAVDAHGPATIVDDGETGWLVPPDDEGAMAEALVEVVTDEDERRRRGEAAYRVARERYSWPALVESLAEVYDEVRAGREPEAGEPESLASAD